jgi:membrane-associated HD superfamily phosphohydrolase
MVYDLGADATAQDRNQFEALVVLFTNTDKLLGKKKEQAASSEAIQQSEQQIQKLIGNDLEILKATAAGDTQLVNLLKDQVEWQKILNTLQEKSNVEIGKAQSMYEEIRRIRSQQSAKASREALDTALRPQRTLDENITVDEQKTSEARSKVFDAASKLGVNPDQLAGMNANEINKFIGTKAAQDGLGGTQLTEIDDALKELVAKESGLKTDQDELTEVYSEMERPACLRQQVR